MSSATLQKRLDVETAAIGSLEQALPAIYELRTPKQAVSFTTVITNRSVEDEMGKIFEREKRLKLPVFIIKRQTVGLNTDYLNNYAVMKHGQARAISRDRQHVNILHAVRVDYSLGITLLTDDFDIMEHWILSLVKYAKNEISLGSIIIPEVENFALPIEAKFGDSYDFPDISKVGEAFSGFEFTTTMQLTTHIADIEIVPTLAEVIIQPYITTQSAYDKIEKTITAGDDASMQAAVNYTDTSLQVVINIRPTLANPAERD